MANHIPEGIKITDVLISELTPASYNPRYHSKESLGQLKQSITKYGVIDPLIVNGAEDRKNIVIGGHMRLKAAQELGLTTIPVVYLNIPNLEIEKELCLRLNHNTGEWDFKLLADFDETFLTDIGFTSEELDSIFEIEEITEEFDLEKELRKLQIDKVNVQAGDRYKLGDSYLLCGDSTIEADMLKLMDGQKADMCLTDPPYILDYLNGGKYKHKEAKGFGSKNNRRYIGTDSLPPDFTEKWMGNIHKVQKKDFSIIVYENWKNMRIIWNEMEKYWRVKNMIIWHLPNRSQGFSAKHKFFSKYDIAMVGAVGTVEYNLSSEEKDLQNEYETALYAISGKPQWEGYQKGKKICPSDFIEFNTDNAKHSGQSVIFGTKPLPILIPYIKVLTKRNDLIVEPFGGSGSTLIAATKMHRRCYIMEKFPAYAEVIMNRWEKATGLKREKCEN